MTSCHDVRPVSLSTASTVYTVEYKALGYPIDRVSYCKLLFLFRNSNFDFGILGE